MTDRILVIDAGSSSVRALVVDAAGQTVSSHRRPIVTSSTPDGLVEIDAWRLAADSVELGGAALADAGPVAGVGIANQRASTVVWERATGRPVAPAIGWQDLRTVGRCLELQGQGLSLAPNATATKAEALLDRADARRSRDLCVGTVDSWLAWALTDGGHHVTDATNASVTGLWDPDGGWNEGVLDALRIPAAVLPEVVDTSGAVGPCTALDGAPTLLALCGDQQASLLGQGCVDPGQSKITVGTGAMLDVVVGQRPARPRNGTFPLVAWRDRGAVTWASEGVVLTAGTAVDWAWRELGLAESAEATDALAASVPDSGGVVFVPALLGLGTPRFDYGARGTLLGLTRGTTRAHVLRAVLEGVANRSADLVEAAEADTGLRIDALRVDGGLSANSTFVQALADAAARPVEISPVREATGQGAAYHAGMAAGLWASHQETARLWSPSEVRTPARTADRGRWAEAVERSRRHHPDLSALSF